MKVSELKRGMQLLHPHLKWGEVAMYDVLDNKLRVPVRADQDAIQLRALHWAEEAGHWVADLHGET